MVRDWFRQRRLPPDRILPQPRAVPGASPAAKRPRLSDRTSFATVRSAFQALPMCRVTSGRLMPSRQWRDTAHLKDLALDKFTNRPGVTRIETAIVYDKRHRHEYRLSAAGKAFPSRVAVKHNHSLHLQPFKNFIVTRH
jgi:hypothetical protein